VEDQLKYNYNYVRQAYTCECGDKLKLSAKYLHVRSDRHKRRMENIENGIPAGHRPCNSQYVCVCGSKILHKNRTQHYKSAKHQAYLKTLLLPIPQNICMEIEEIDETVPQVRISLKLSLYLSFYNSIIQYIIYLIYFLLNHLKIKSLVYYIYNDIP
jgi:hypothetical protein